MNSDTSAPRVKAGVMAVVIASMAKHPEILCRQVEVVSLASNDEIEIDGWTYDAVADPSARYWVVKAKGCPFYAISDSLYGVVIESALLPIGGAGLVDLVAAERETADLC